MKKLILLLYLFLFLVSCSSDLSNSNNSNSKSYNSSEKYISSIAGIDAFNNVHIVATKTKTDSQTVLSHMVNNVSTGEEIPSLGTSIDWRYSQFTFAIDSNNKMHICYLWNGLMYLTNFTGIWTTQQIAKQLPGDWTGPYSPSLAVDSKNNVHIAYVGGQRALKYINNIGGQWNDYTLETGFTDTMNPSLAIDHNDKIHISYYSNIDGSYEKLSVKYITNISGNWIITTIASNGVNAGAIAVDANNKVHICYVKENDMMYTTNSSGNWVSTLINQGYYTNTEGWGPSINFDSQGKVFISYAGSSYSVPYDPFIVPCIKYATNKSGSWQWFILDPNSYVCGSRTSLLIDKNDKIYILYTEGTDSSLKLLKL